MLCTMSTVTNLIFLRSLLLENLVYIDAYSLEYCFGCASLLHMVEYKFESSGLTQVIFYHCHENLVGTSEFQI